MISQTTLYNAYTGISPVEKSAVVAFLFEHTEDSSRRHIQEAVEYAVKDKPSFGGFILTAQKDRKIVAAIVANQTGMGGYSPSNIFVYVTLHKGYRKDKILVQHLMQKAISYADGEIALHVEPDNPALKMYQELGFKAQFLELRLNKPQSSSSAIG